MLEGMVNGALLAYVASTYLFHSNAWISIASNAGALIFGLLVAVRVALRRNRIVADRYVQLLLLFLGVSVASCFVAVDQNATLVMLRRLLLNSAFSVLLVSYVDSLDKLTGLIYACVFGGTVASLLVFSEFDPGYPQRLGGSLGNENVTGVMIGLSCVFSFHLVLNERKYACLPSALVTLVAVLLTGSRTALLFVVVNGLLMTFFGTNRRFRSRLIWVLGTVFVGAFLCYLVLRVPLFYRVVGRRFESLLSLVLSSRTSEDSLQMRAYMIQYGLALARDRPLLGYGLDNYGVLIRDVIGKQTYSHNNYVELLVGSGIVGVASYYSIHATLIAALVNRMRYNRRLASLFLSLMISILIIGYSSVQYYARHIFLVLSMASIAVRLSRRSRRSALTASMPIAETSSSENLLVRQDG